MRLATTTPRRSRRTAALLLVVATLTAIASGASARGGGGRWVAPISTARRPAAASAAAAPSSTVASVISAPRGGGGKASSASSSSDAAAVAAVVVKSGPLDAFFRTIRDARRHLAAAGVARSVSIFAMYPVDTIKTRMQMEQPNPLRMTGLYNGVGGSLLGQVPYGVLTFGSYEMYKSYLLKRFPDVRPVFLYALSAVLGDVTGSGWLCPSEVVKQQTQAGMYESAGAAVKGIWAKRGFRGFYQGYLGGLSRDIPFRVAQLTSYEVTKSLYLKVKGRRMKKAAQESSDDALAAAADAVELSPVDAAVCGAIAGTFSSAATAPLDRIKTILMTGGGGGYGNSVASCAAKIWRDEGLSGFFQGVVPRVTYIAPSVVIFFIAYEQVQQRLAP